MVVRFIWEKLWTHVVWSPYECAGHIILVLQYSCDAQVPNFDDVGLCQEDILCFKVTVKNIPLMQVLQNKIMLVQLEAFDSIWLSHSIFHLECHGYLDEPLHHLPLR